MASNLGATRVGTAIGDVQAYGDLYQWGRPRDGHEKRSSGSVSMQLTGGTTPDHGDFIVGEPDWIDPPNASLWQGVSGVNQPIPGCFRLLTDAEWEEEHDAYGPSQVLDLAYPCRLRHPAVPSLSRLRVWGNFLSIVLLFSMISPPSPPPPATD